MVGSKMVAYQLRLKHFNFPKIAEVLSDNFFELHDPNTLLHVSVSLCLESTQLCRLY